MGTAPVIVARFSDALQAEVARSTIEEMLAGAEGEVVALLQRQNGVAEMADLSKIYSRYGFRNDCGWSLERAIVASGQDVVWEVPDGMFVEDAQVLLLALGAQFVAVRPEWEPPPWLYGPHPGAYLAMGEETEIWDSDEDEAIQSAVPDKKTLH